MEHFLGLPIDASAHGPEIDNMIAIVHWLMFVLFIGWGVFFTYTLVRFRKGRQAKANHAGAKTHASSYLEVAVALLKSLIVLVRETGNSR